MNRYKEGIKIMEDTCGGGKDNVIALTTIGMVYGKPCPFTRNVNAFYEDGVFLYYNHGNVRKGASDSRKQQCSVCSSL